MTQNKLICSKVAYKQDHVLDTTLKYLTPDYFLPASCSESYYSKKYVGNSNLNLKSKYRKIARVASTILLSLSFLATAVEVKAKPNLGASASSSSIVLQSPQQQVNFQSSQQQPVKKKPLLKRAAHKVSKRLGFSGVVAATREPEISMEELKELYSAEYGESIDVTISRGDGKTSGLAEALRKSLALREKTLERRRVNDIFSSEPIYSEAIDTISIASGSSTEYEEPWSDPDIEIGEALETEFSTSKKQQRFEPSAPPLAAFSSLEELNETKAMEVLDQAIEDSGYSSSSISSSPTNEVGFQGGYETDISNCSFYDTSSTEYDTEVKIRSYENVPQQSRTKKLRTRKARNASSAGAEARYSYRDIEQGLASFQSDTDFSDEWSDASSLSSTDGYDTVYTSSNSDAGSHFEDETSEWDTDFSDDSSDEYGLPPPPSAEELAALETQHIELEKLTEPVEREQLTEVSKTDEVDYVRATDVLEAASTDFSFTNQEMTKEVSNVSDIKDITEDLQEESTSASVLEILDQKSAEEDSVLQNISKNLVNIEVTKPQEQSTVRSQEELLKKSIGGSIKQSSSTPGK